MWQLPIIIKALVASEFIFLTYLQIKRNTNNRFRFILCVNKQFLQIDLYVDQNLNNLVILYF